MTLYSYRSANGKIIELVAKVRRNHDYELLLSKGGRIRFRFQLVRYSGWHLKAAMSVIKQHPLPMFMAFVDYHKCNEPY